MEKKSLFLNVLLAVVLGAGLLVGIVWTAFQPNVVLPDLDLPATAAIVLIALLIEYHAKGIQERAWVPQTILAAVTFAVLPFAAGYVGAGIGVTVYGTALFTVITWLFDSVAERMSVTTDCKGVMIPTAFVMYLAFQCLMGVLL